jgi:hypothetical protein
MSPRLCVFAAIAIVSASCGGGSPCDRSSPCPNDTMATPAERDQCKSTLNANMNSPCYNETISLANCITDNTVCSSAGKTDPALSQTKWMNNCTSQLVSRSTCCTKNPTASACL